MSFKFKLEKVLHHRKSLEDQARKEYLEAQAELTAAENLLADYHSKIENENRNRHDLILIGGTHTETLRQINDYIKGTEIKIERQKIIIKNIKSKVEELQLALQKASIEYKMIEKLEERQRNDYRLIEKKLEEKELNEMVNARFTLRQKNE